MRIVQLSDSHLSCDKPARAAEFEACIAHINGLQPQPDVVVHTGDIAHDGLVEEYRIARAALDRLSAPYFVLAGNRDNRRNLIEAFADGHHLRSDLEFVQYAVEEFEVRLIMIDTVSTRSNKGRLCAERLDHVREMLAFDTSRPVVLFLHHPPFEVGVGPEPRNFEEWSDVEILMAELKRHDNIIGLCCGHVHRVFETTVGAVPASVVSSIASDLRWDNPETVNGVRQVVKSYRFPART